MRFLLDTHILLWAISNDERLSEKARKLIENADNEIFYSIALVNKNWTVALPNSGHWGYISLRSTRFYS